MGRHERPLGIVKLLMVLTFMWMAQSPCMAESNATGLTIGFAQLSAQGVSQDLAHAAILVPRQLLSLLDFVTLRYPGDEELLARLKKVDELRLEDARKALASARLKRDVAALSVRDPAKRMADMLSADALIRKSEAELSTLQKSMTLSIPDYGEPLGILRWPEHANGLLLPATHDPASLCAEKKLDLLLYGTMTSKADYLAIELFLYVASLGESVWSVLDYSSEDGLDELLQALIRPLAEAIIGTSYTRVLVRLTPPLAELTIDESSHDGSTLLYYVSGSHRLKAKAKGFAPASTTFIVNPGNDTFIDIELEELPAFGFSLTSDPAGASIHLDGLGAGFTPLDIARLAFPMVARVSMPGFDDTQIVLRPRQSADDRLVILVPSDGLSFDDRFDARKGAFYRSLGWFVVSLPVPVISGGLFNNYLSLLETVSSSADFGGIDKDMADRLSRKFYTSQTIFWVSAAVTAGTAINAMFKLHAYIKTTR